MTPEIQLTGKASKLFAIIDPEMFVELSKYKWHLHSKGYAVTNIKGKKVFMHTLVAGKQKGLITDHRNSNKLDNRKENLRLCSIGQNNQNRAIYKNNTSGFKGVRFESGKFRCRIKLNGKMMHIGYFVNAVDAAIAYNEKAVELFGEFAQLNVIDELAENDFVIAASYMPNAGEKKQIQQIKKGSQHRDFYVLIFIDGTSGFAKNYKKP